MTVTKLMTILDNSLETNRILCNELKQDRPIIIPTDTNYNLACLPTSIEAIDLIFEYKKRIKDKPLSLFFLNPNDWTKYGEVDNPQLMNHLVKTFLPGALNIVVRNKTQYNYMLNDSNSIALGCLKNPAWRAFMKLLNSPIAITSANISGTADDLLITENIAVTQMGNKVNYMLRSNTTIETTKSSTIISLLESDKIIVLREGDITLEQLKIAVSDWGYSVEKR